MTYGVEWVTIDDPDPTFAPGTTNNQAIVAIGDQGRAQGAAIFSRLEGIFSDEAKVYLVSTQGGDTPPGEPPPAGYGDGFGQLWVYDTSAETLTLLFESPSRTVLELPDNICISPRKCSLLCEDGPTENLLRGVTPDGEIFDFALNATRRPRTGGVRGLDVHARRQGPVREHPGEQRHHVRDLGAVEARGAVARRPPSLRRHP